MKTIIITGAHHNSALVVAQEVMKRGYKVAWLGHRYAGRGDQHDSAEYLEVTATKIPFYQLHAGKISSPLRLDELCRLPLGVLQALWLLLRLRPTALVSFGGYLGATAALASFLLRVPVYLHEQTIVGGKANHWAARFAKKIYLTWNSSLHYFPASKSEVVGLPLHSGLLSAKPKKLFANKRQTILVVGGKQGSHTINQVVFDGLARLTKKYNIIHQTGTSSITGDYVASLKLRSTHYAPYGYIASEEIGGYYAAADVVISRSGAHTVYELGALGKRSILIPFMHTTGQEQLEQARLLSAAGIATIIMESDLTPSTLITQIERSLKLPAPIPLALQENAKEHMVTSLTSELK